MNTEKSLFIVCNRICSSSITYNTDITLKILLITIADSNYLSKELVQLSIVFSEI